ncbi:RNA-binding protein CP29B, chloroplastic-like isoform X2 [Pyrus x bretschneideri]|uniref:RNA-binding protein CP29B, chloroplastic-like isoform X2 n=1 Tax=Pyrus x bretschneideri TaxID=225117 RepID=UPI00202DF52D|nr:RNA-binding protein CP29B, chloroplastic-like isoform X2 [Pyrus x bretschneideri]
MVKVIYDDKTTGRSRGFRFVTMSSVQEAEYAARQLNGYELDGRALRSKLPPGVESALLQQVLSLAPEKLSSLSPEQQEEVIKLQ